MNYTYVNKNYLIPEIINYLNIEKAINKLYNVTFNMNNDYCKNVYIVENNNNIIYTNNNIIYQINANNEITMLNKKYVDINTLNYINSNPNLLNIPNKSETVSEMELVINSKKSNIIIDKNNETKIETKIEKKVILKKELTEEELKVLKICEEVMALYESEVLKIKNIRESK